MVMVGNMPARVCGCTTIVIDRSDAYRAAGSAWLYNHNYRVVGHCLTAQTCTVVQPDRRTGGQSMGRAGMGCGCKYIVEGIGTTHIRYRHNVYSNISSEV